MMKKQSIFILLLIFCMQLNAQFSVTLMPFRSNSDFTNVGVENGGADRAYSQKNNWKSAMVEINLLRITDSKQGASVRFNGVVGYQKFNYIEPNYTVGNTVQIEAKSYGLLFRPYSPAGPSRGDHSLMPYLLNFYAEIGVSNMSIIESGAPNVKLNTLYSGLGWTPVFPLYKGIATGFNISARSYKWKNSLGKESKIISGNRGFTIIISPAGFKAKAKNKVDLQ